SSGRVDRIVPPGAPTSGLKLRSAARPNDEKLEMRLLVGFTSPVTWFVHVRSTTPLASRASINAPRAAVTATTGIVIGGIPATVGEMNPATLLYSTTPIAPADCALNDFS